MSFIDWQIAKITTVFLLSFLGAACFVAFAFTLKLFWVLPFLAVSAGVWYLFYFLFSEMRSKWVSHATPF
jgi:hypothetical protein